MVPMHTQRSDGALRLGLVGPGRTRNGLGPFLARHLERAGARIVAVSGRTRARTAAAAEELARDLGHPVAAHGGVDELVRHDGLHGLVIAAPIEAHLEALAAAAAARLPTLCEKPLVDPRQLAEARRLVATFASAGVPLLENCQWPLAVAALRRGGVVPSVAPSDFAMRLSPAGRGRSMLVDSLSHFLSVLQGLDVLAESAQLERIEFSSRDPAAGAMVLELGLRAADSDASRRARAVSARLELVHCPQQPRPAWLEFDGRRLERRLALPAYHWSFADGQSEHGIGDPQAELAYSFVEILTHPSPDLVRRHAAAVTARAELFTDIVGAHDR
ncbi:MAG: Gfo/Idh/MocA family oxidoreductase [Planctomycetota bacterium]